MLLLLLALFLPLRVILTCEFAAFALLELELVVFEEAFDDC